MSTPNSPISTDPRHQSQPLWKHALGVVLFGVAMYAAIGINKYLTLQSNAAMEREAIPSVYTFPDDPIIDMDHHSVVLSGNAVPTQCQATHQSRLSTSLTESAQRAVTTACRQLVPLGHRITVRPDKLITVTALCRLQNREEIAVIVNRAPVLVGEKCY